MTLLLVALGGGAGAVVRFLVGVWRPGRGATLAVNVVGSALLGALAGASASVAALVGVGFCGGLTTFSTFAVEVAADVRAPSSRRYVLATVVLCVGAAAVTRAVAR